MVAILKNLRNKWLEVVVTVLSLYNHDVEHPKEEEFHPAVIVRKDRGSAK